MPHALRLVLAPDGVEPADGRRIEIQAHERSGIETQPTHMDETRTLDSGGGSPPSLTLCLLKNARQILLHARS